MKIMLTDKETEKLEKAKYRRIILTSDDECESLNAQAN